MNLSLSSQIEGILFVEAKAITFKKLSELLTIDAEQVKKAVLNMSHQYDDDKRGLRIIVTGSSVQMVTAPELHDVISAVIKDERTGELTKPSLETLSIIAYRNPATKAELESIRGVNCSLILRNLLIRGLIREWVDKDKGVAVYDITQEYLQLLGVSRTDQLPDYERLSRDIKIGEVLGEMTASEDFFENLTDTTTNEEPKDD